VGRTVGRRRDDQARNGEAHVGSPPRTFIDGLTIDGMPDHEDALGFSNRLVANEHQDGSGKTT